jgi:hypothetical protein
MGTPTEVIQPANATVLFHVSETFDETAALGATWAAAGAEAATGAAEADVTDPTARARMMPVEAKSFPSDFITSSP